MKKYIFTVYLLIIGLNFCFAQDTLITINNDTLCCKIKTIETDELKYRIENNDIIFGIASEDVTKIVDKRGRTIERQMLIDGPQYTSQKKNSLEFRALSPYRGFSEFSYERSIKPGASIEFSLSIAGAGEHNGRFDAKGITYRGGYKLIKSPGLNSKLNNKMHLLKGAYFKPELAYSDFYDNNELQKVRAAAILFNFGYQFVYKDLIIADWYFATGYGISNSDVFRYYGYFGYFKDAPLAISSGFKIGILF